MTTLKRIAAYQTTDGRTFDDKDVAKKHQAELDRMAKVKELVAKGMGAVDMAEGDDLYAVIANLIVSNADALREILPKKAKAAKAQEPVKPDAEQGAAPATAVVPPAIETCEQRPTAEVPESAADQAKLSPAAEFAWPAGLSATLNTTQAA
ncbi:hypothetical protein WK03_35255 [Burkholderia cepacia]|uniref:hypothetical protein n=1 Tax=Burkholderia cepacia TaxID=292 RepID=UPI000757202A|nr:hypothetical protein [Burkholderia cepacia]KVQ35728.1 hypothetical protein WK03_35255 [Burkholderia cepacia]